MKRINFFAAGTVVLLAGCAAMSSMPGDDPLANGLTGDVSIATGSDWMLMDGVLSSVRGEPMGFVYTNRSYSDFELNAEIYVEGQTNSGIFVRCESMPTISPMVCYEFNIWDSHANPESKTGSIVTFAGPMAEVSTEDEWSDIRVRLVGNHLQMWVDGTATADIMDDTYAEGPIAFQYGGSNGLVKFRNIRIQDLSETAAEM